MVEEVVSVVQVAAAFGTPYRPGEKRNNDPIQAEKPGAVKSVVITLQCSCLLGHLLGRGIGFLVRR